MTKTKLYLMGAGLAGLIVAASATGASAAPVDCPLSMAKREIVNPLPGGWWTTPIVNSLSDTKVVVIGGKPTLQCVYGSAGSIQKLAPVGQICSPTPGGFNCKFPILIPPGPLPIPTPQTYTTGPVVLPQTYLVDFDSGNVQPGGADLWFQAATPFVKFLTPRNGAMIAVGDRSNRGYFGCKTASYTSASVPLSAVPVGSYICMKTNQGRISQFRMNAITGPSVQTLQMGYTTWK